MVRWRSLSHHLPRLLAVSNAAVMFASASSHDFAERKECRELMLSATMRASAARSWHKAANNCCTAADISPSNHTPQKRSTLLDSPAPIAMLLNNAAPAAMLLKVGILPVEGEQNPVPVRFLFCRRHYNLIQASREQNNALVSGSGQAPLVRE